MTYATPSTLSKARKSNALATCEEAKNEIRDIVSAITASGELYGKTKDNIVAGMQIIIRELAEVPAEKVVSAFKAHFRHSSRMPTVADIAGFIRRGGLPPLERSVYIRLAQKDPIERTSEDQEYIRLFEKEALTPLQDITAEDPYKASALSEDNARLRKRLIALQTENSRLSDLLTAARRDTALPTKSITHEARVGRTALEMMRQEAPCSEICEFLKMEAQNGQ